ncbi:MAG: hypothetical protein AAF799_30830 [Myxococcota bacterium]
MKLDREQWVAEYTASAQAYSRWMNAATPTDGSFEHHCVRSFRELVALELRYAEALPTVALSRCPLCDKPALQRFDAADFFGPWWHPDFVAPKEPGRCPHFMGVLGAVHHHGHAHRAGRLDVHPGPEVPFVVPRLMALPGVVAVVRELRMDNGCTAYPIGYFAPRRPPPRDRFAPWARGALEYQDLDGGGWRPAEGDRDFELRAYVERGALKVLDGELQLRTPKSDHPLLHVEGRRVPIVVGRREFGGDPGSGL